MVNLSSFHIASLLTESNAFSKSINTAYNRDDHSKQCSIIICNILI